MSSRVKILVIGPTKSGKSTIANIIGELADGPSELYRPTVGCRIVELERDPPPAVASFGKFTLELWDVSGDFKYEKCWGPIQKDAHGKRDMGLLFKRALEAVDPLGIDQEWWEIRGITKELFKTLFINLK